MNVVLPVTAVLLFPGTIVCKTDVHLYVLYKVLLLIASKCITSYISQYLKLRDNVVVEVNYNIVLCVNSCWQKRRCLSSPLIESLCTEYPCMFSFASSKLKTMILWNLARTFSNWNHTRIVVKYFAQLLV